MHPTMASTCTWWFSPGTIDITTHDGNLSCISGSMLVLSPEDLERARADRVQADEERQTAEQRALALLATTLGDAAVAKIRAGGAYAIPSKRWPNVEYLVPKAPNERIKVVDRGSVVTEICIVTTDASLPWPDVMLQRITAIKADESVLYQTGVIHDRRPPGWRNRFARIFGAR